MAWKPKQALRVVDGFVAALNAHDAYAAIKLLHPYFNFIDSTGGQISGRRDCEIALQRFVRLDDLFAITIDKRTVHVPEILLTGSTFARDPRLARKMLWRAEVRDGMLSEWQSYGRNNPPPLARMLMREEPVQSGGLATLPG